MNHLESAFSGKNAFWRYIVMFVAVLLAANTIGAIPLIVAMVIKASSNPEILSGLATNPSDMGLLGMKPLTGLIVMLVPFLAGVITFALLIKTLNNRTLVQTINGTSSIRWKRIFVSAVIWLAISAVYLMVQRMVNPGDFVIKNTGRIIIAVAAVSLLLIPFQAAFEELLFRGYLMQGFGVLTRNRWAPVILTSLSFGLLHAFNPEVKEFGFFTMMPQYILFGLVFGITTVIDDGIEISLGAHAANNIFLSIMVTSSSSALQTPAVFEQTVIHPWGEFTGLLISSIIFILLLKYIYRWKDLRVLFSKIDYNPTLN